jgi:starch synthase (maltosyl-transferring)
MPDGLKRRVVIEGVSPEIDCGRFPVKRVLGESVTVEADAFTDGHDVLSVVLLHRPEVPGTSGNWMETPMEPLGNDRFRGSFPVLELGRHEYTVEAWIDRFGSWRRDLEKRVAARQKPDELAVDLRIGAGLLREAAKRASSSGKGGRKDGKVPVSAMRPAKTETKLGAPPFKASATACVCSMVKIAVTLSFAPSQVRR